jgi:hypothetical protein
MSRQADDDQFRRDCLRSRGFDPGVGSFLNGAMRARNVCPKCGKRCHDAASVAQHIQAKHPLKEGAK